MANPGGFEAAFSDQSFCRAGSGDLGQKKSQKSPGVPPAAQRSFAEDLC